MTAFNQTTDPGAKEPVLCWENTFMPAAMAIPVAIYCASKFYWWMPMPDGWQTITTLNFPLVQADFLFHEGGHPIIGMMFFNNEFMTYLGGTLGQFVFPVTVLVLWWKAKKRASVVFALYWIGLNFAECSWYAADAKQQVITLISGTTGSEGGPHDWREMLWILGWKLETGPKIGKFFMFIGSGLMAFGPAYAICWGLRKAGILAAAPGD